MAPLANLGEAAEKCVYRHRGCLRPIPTPPDEPQAEAEPTASSPWPTGHRFAERTRGKHAAIHTLLAAGHSKRSVARQLDMTLNTILRFSRAATAEELFTGQWQSRATKLDAYKPYLDQRWREGCTNAWRLWGRPVSRRRVPRPPSARAVTQWILTHPNALAEGDRLQFKAVLAACPELTVLAEHVRSSPTCSPTRKATNCRHGSKRPPPPKPKRRTYAAIRRAAWARMSYRALMREHGVGYRTVKAALESVWPQPRRRPTAARSVLYAVPMRDIISGGARWRLGTWPTARQLRGAGGSEVSRVQAFANAR
ncbi:hypothetical protein [Streptomyces sp. NL15-2K]|uniref:hypothetical protein n=1 Tax=Streptomyces sp. NL15-2K TaxID=376149 RepID=UPI00209C439C|nr:MULTISPECIES: hypothetical protein [Actinomycetes]WKX15851.1 hypothetical protein Q4V64_53530 [Kutzneria buriramensis]